MDIAESKITLFYFLIIAFVCNFTLSIVSSVVVFDYVFYSFVFVPGKLGSLGCDWRALSNWTRLTILGNELTSEFLGKLTSGMVFLMGLLDSSFVKARLLFLRMFWDILRLHKISRLSLAKSRKNFLNSNFLSVIGLNNNNWFFKCPSFLLRWLHNFISNS